MMELYLRTVENILMFETLCFVISNTVLSVPSKRPQNTCTLGSLLARGRVLRLPDV